MDWKWRKFETPIAKPTPQKHTKWDQWKCIPRKSNMKHQTRTEQKVNKLNQQGCYSVEKVSMKWGLLGKGRNKEKEKEKFFEPRIEMETKRYLQKRWRMYLIED